MVCLIKTARVRDSYYAPAGDMEAVVAGKRYCYASDGRSGRLTCSFGAHVGVREAGKKKCLVCADTDGRNTPDAAMSRDFPDMILSREDARAMGFSRFRTGTPCKHGHSGWRYTSTGGCIPCLRPDSLGASSPDLELTEMIQHARDLRNHLPPLTHRWAQESVPHDRIGDAIRGVPMQYSERNPHRALWDDVTAALPAEDVAAWRQRCALLRGGANPPSPGERPAPADYVELHQRPVPPWEVEATLSRAHALAAARGGTLRHSEQHGTGDVVVLNLWLHPDDARAL
jgi:hypothetical protein